MKLNIQTLSDLAWQSKLIILPWSSTDRTRRQSELTKVIWNCPWPRQDLENFIEVVKW
jgi:hypothetical protein